LFSMNFGDADLVREITHFRFAIPGEDIDELELMLRTEVLNKGTSFGPRRIAQSECRSKLAVYDEDAFEATGDRRKVRGAGDVLRKELAAAGELNLVTADGSAQSLTGRLVHMRCLLEVKPFRFRRCEDGPGQRML